MEAMEVGLYQATKITAKGIINIITVREIFNIVLIAEPKSSINSSEIRSHFTHK